MCVTNLREIPDDLDTKWNPQALIQVEYSQLTNVPIVLTRLQPNYLAVTGNPITELPSEMFEVEGMTYMGIGEHRCFVSERDAVVFNLITTLSYIYMGNTNISFLWSWVDELVQDEAPPWLAGASTYCNDLTKIEEGTANSFHVPMSPEYSVMLMNASEGNRPVILNAVDCDSSVEMMFYPLAIEDSINAISAPPPLIQQQ